MSLIEVLAALAIVAVMIVGTMTVVSSAHNLTRNTTNKEFATQKAISMLEELKSVIQSTQSSSAVTLDAYDNGATFTTPLLTIQGAGANNTPITTLPDDPISGNTSMGPSKWLFARHISVQKLPGQSNDVRLVNVQVYQNTPAGQVLLAEVASVLRTVVDNMPPSQVYDVYGLALENVPGWWVYMSNVVPFVKSAVDDLQARNPGLIFRTHWITALAYGRDLQYRPYVNDAQDSWQNIPYVYFYPGKMPLSTALGGTCICGDDYYYPSFFFSGHIMIDGNDKNGFDPAKNPAPYALADQYNHAMRYLDELATYNARKNANPNEQMTWRLLMDDMFLNPSKYTNALLINLHGELMPFPPMRNYSDAAKDPGQTAGPDLRGIRAVTHPEQLRYTNADDVYLRVYTYLQDPNTPPNNVPNDISPVNVTIRISGTKNWAPAAVGDVGYIRGGVDNDGVGGADPYDAAPVNALQCPAAGRLMCWSSTLSGSDTVITLRNSPLRSPIIDNTGRGLAAENRLYGMEYIPSPMENLTTCVPNGCRQFMTDLTTPSLMPKNTARWIIRVPVAAMNNNALLTVETRLGDDLTTGTIANKPPDLSRTYVWRGDDNWVAANLPMSERFQFQGDPRHLPYADLKRPHISVPGVFPPAAIIGPPAVPQGGFENSLGMGYNRYFDDFEAQDPDPPCCGGVSQLYNRGASAELTGLVAGNYAIQSSAPANNVFAVHIDGGATITEPLTTGGARTAVQIATELNANAAFNLVAFADVISNRVRVRSKARVNSSVRLDATCSACITLGFTTTPTSGVLDVSTHIDAPWRGWFYTVGVQQYGIKNDGVLGNAGWNTQSGYLDIDVHRFFQVLRSGLVRSNAIWTTMTGFSYYYIGIGNEIGYDSANQFDNSIPVSTRPFTGASGQMYENSITGTNKYIRNQHNVAAGTPCVAASPCWWALPWVGELYPDSVYAAQWAVNGNLTSGTGDTNFIRVARRQYSPTFDGTALIDTLKRTNEEGSTTLFWTGNAAATFHHDYRDGHTADIQTPGKDIADHYSLPVPNNIESSRPFDINYNSPGFNPESFLQPGAYPGAYTTKVLNTYYLNKEAPLTPTQSSALITLTDPATLDPTFIAVNGLSPSGITGTTFVAKWSFLTLTQSFFNGGLYTDASANPKAKHIRQVPRVVITDPNAQTNLKDPGSVNIKWDTTWFRWDGLPYTSDPLYNGWYETLTMKYAVLYSPSNGVPDIPSGNTTGWFYVKDNTVATPGVKPDAAHEVAQSITGPTTTNAVSWSTPSNQFPQGNYIIRVEGYREGWQLHYSYHQYRAFIQR